MKDNEGRVWQLSKGVYALRIVEKTMIDSKYIVIPKVIIPFFEVSDSKDKIIKLKYLESEYKCYLKYDKKSKNMILTFEEDLYNIILGIYNSVSRDVESSKVYIMFMKKPTSVFGFKIGMAKI